MNEQFQVSASKEAWIKEVKSEFKKQLNQLPTTRNIAYKVGSALSLVTDLHKETLKLKAALNRLLEVFVDKTLSEGYTLSDEELSAASAARELLAVAEGDEAAPPAVTDL